MDVLRLLNVAPTQIWPNSWAFICAFEILWEALDKTPTAGAFFHFYGNKGVDKGSWVSVSAHAGKKLFPSYASNFKKNWRVSFMRVSASKDSCVSVASVDGELRFPLSWTSSPQSVCGYDLEKMSPYECGVVGFLDRMSLVDIHMLLNKETNSVDLELYLREYDFIIVLCNFCFLVCFDCFLSFLFVLQFRCCHSHGKKGGSVLLLLKKRTLRGSTLLVIPPSYCCERKEGSGPTGRMLGRKGNLRRMQWRRLTLPIANLSGIMIFNIASTWRSMFPSPLWMKMLTFTTSLVTWLRMLAPTPLGSWCIFILWSGNMTPLRNNFKSL